MPLKTSYVMEEGVNWYAWDWDGHVLVSRNLDKAPGVEVLYVSRSKRPLKRIPREFLTDGTLHEVRIEDYHWERY